MIVSFSAAPGERKTCVLTDTFDLSEFKSSAEKLFGSLENFRFIIKGKFLEMNDAETFKAQRILFRDYCNIYVVQRMMTGNEQDH